MIHEKNHIPVVIICGPTACGKTSLAYKLFAESMSDFSSLAGKGEIISADSMQVYRNMDIGTAKPDKNTLKTLPHHLINICNPNEAFGAGEFVRHANNAIADIVSRGKIPVMVGGTAFYIKNFMYGLPPTPRSDENLRTLLENRMKNEGAEKLRNELYALDPCTAEKIHIHDEYRIKRALEVCLATGKPLSSFYVSQKKQNRYDFFVIVLERNRQELYALSDARAEEMFSCGLAEEVAMLRAKGYTECDPGMKAIGYREFFSSDDVEEIKALIKKNSRAYIKRQQTFFKTFEDSFIASPDNFQIIQKKIADFCFKGNGNT